MPRHCPHCSTDLSEYPLATACPQCHQDLPPPVFQSDWVDWKKVLLFSFGPAVICLLTILGHAGVIAGLVGTFASWGCGAYCAKLVMEGFNLTGARRTLLYLSLVVVFCGLNVVFCFLGCAGGMTVSGEGF